MKFPITPLLPQILEALEHNTRLVLEAPPGAGKTTQVPPALLEAPWLDGKRILLLEPRRIAARAAATFMAGQLGEAVGRRVGYAIRFESRLSAATRIEVITEGLLTRRIQDDPALEDVGAILFDEFHERHLAGDLGAALALDVQAGLRPDLRLVVMSATLDGERIAQWLDAPRISSPGRSFPVRIEHPPARAQESTEQHLARTVRQALAEIEGDVLAFLPGQREIARATRLLDEQLDADIEVLPLHGELALADQQAALAPADDARRRVILATNVAESSVTLPGIRAVVDSGLARVPQFDPNSGFTRLRTVTVARDSADQRAGRAGRVAPGVAYRLWPQSQRLDAERIAEIAQAELSGLALELAAWGHDALPWLDPPPSGALAQARDLLRRLGALDAEHRITALGRAMHALGATPRLAAAVTRANEAQHGLMADLLALLDARSPLRGEHARNDDFRQRVQALHVWRDGGASAARRFGADAGALAAIERAARGWRQRIGARAAASGTPHSHAVGDLLAHAFPDRIAMQVEGQPLRYQLSNGRGARLHEATALLGEPWLVVLDLRLESRDSLIFAAAPFDPALLQRDYGERFVTQRAVRWNADREAVEAFEERRFDALVLERRSVPVRAEDALPALLARVRERGLESLPWSDAARRLRARIQALRGWMPESGLPDVSDDTLLATLETWLGPYLDGKRKLDALSAAELSQALVALLDYGQRQQLDAQAPEALTVPSGRTHKLVYTPDAPPVLAVKLQELFGLADTPRVGGGRVPVTLHLLSPAGRPMQVTQDLAGFWERTYPEVKKELKGRYPKHPWPDDPWSATPTHRTRRHAGR
ncbi:ATP-dependent helicase HrpB [Oleiagrimonas citrea]|uniref:ATP-dependent helicase HrpB n=1 Tax=Oleiagrimonas citrea TaxID=1665687 RepID=A0A846ZM46_9GAMM|nr:ATP-dependent helicase HrpB [Oleiagrimonas citrea]NKZ38630.1 ATP-dependent helicase HrpB [Oleiagrimonas citrea]